MTRLAKDCHLQVCTYHSLSHTSCMLSCSLFYCISGLFADIGALVTVRSNIVRQDMEEGGT